MEPALSTRTLTLRQRLGRWAYGRLLIGSVQLAFRGLRHWPTLRPERRGIRVERDVAYGPLPAQRLDIYRPSNAPGPCAASAWAPKKTGPMPVALYVHGGGFKYFSRSTHWAMATAFAERGYLTYCIDYRLAPAHRYPAASEDAATACAWALRHAAANGGDLERMVWAGESAGANLVLGLAIAACWRRPEPLARAVFEAGPPPKVLLPACGYLEVSRPERHYQDRAIAGWIKGRIHQVSDEYLPDHATPSDAHVFANPLVFLETAGPPDRPFPATFGVVGDKDPVMGDTLRLPDAVRRHGATARSEVYAGGMHAFHAIWFKALAKRAWADQFAFIAECSKEQQP